ncbi:hypothetical protein N7G274_009351 [Stereocaulon virgatum]|uniref:Uncharacterized protein n=1 Tax=Stereocaulon virgatum TaxID=373712 RepID=A0ABR3ZYP6_9LECA
MEGFNCLAIDASSGAQKARQRKRSRVHERGYSHEEFYLASKFNINRFSLSQRTFDAAAYQRNFKYAELTNNTHSCTRRHNLPQIHQGPSNLIPQKLKTQCFSRFRDSSARKPRKDSPLHAPDQASAH